MENKKVGFYGGKFIPLHNGHIYSIIKARSQVDKLYVVVAYVESRDKDLCEKNGIPYIHFNTRLKWLKEITKDWDNVEVIAVEDCYEGDLENMWKVGAESIIKTIPEKITHIFSSESSYEQYFKRYYGQDVNHIILDEDRSNFNVSATKIRTEGIFENWDLIPKVAQPYYTKKIAIVGTESCGKSTLVKSLATLFNTNYVEEYGRTRCEELGDGSELLTEQNYREFAIGQKNIEFRKILDSNKLLFIDSEAVVTQFYAELYQNEHYNWLDGIIGMQDYDLYIYLESDVKWVSDGYRVHGTQELREKNNIKLKQMYADYGIELQIISGNYDDRLDKCIELVKNIM